MAAKIALEAVFIKARNRWRVDVPASKTDNGKRIRAHFKTREAAREYILKLDGPAPSAAIDPRLAMDADTARQRIEAAGLDMTLAEIVAAYVEAKAALNGSGTLLEAAQAFSRHHDARTSSKPLSDAVTAYLDAKEGTLRPATLKSYKYTLEKVLLPIHTETVSDITTESLVALLGHRKPTARAMHLRNLRTFWAWVCKAPRGWASMAAVDALEYRKDAQNGDIDILSPSEVSALLSAAEIEGHAAAATYALAVFGGIRMNELSLLTWASVGEDHIEIGRDVAKKHARRLVPICPTLRAWIDAHRNESKDEESIVPANWADVSKSVRRRAGWDVAARLLTDPPKPTRGAWPANAPRHTCASVQIATGATLEDLTFKFGHAGGHDMLRAHYVSRLTKKDALAILSTGPKGRKVKLVHNA